MTTVFDDGIVKLVHGDAIKALRELDDASVDAIVTDPPYGLEFMGREWDGADGFRRSLNPADVERNDVFGRTSATSPEYRATPEYQQWCEAWAKECLRALKPGGHLLAFGGTRTYHRLATAIEDAGFDIRDCLVWAYASGFPKSLDVSKAIDKAAGAEPKVVGQRTDGRYAYGFTEEAKKALGATVAAENESGFSGAMGIITEPFTDAAKQWQGWGTALKPAWEPIVMARKPFTGTVASNVLEHGTGALNIDATRIPVADADDIHAKNPHTVGTIGENGIYGSGTPTLYEMADGRWPANVMLTDPIFDGDYPEEVAGGGASTSIGHFPSDRGPSGMFSGEGGGLDGDHPDERHLELGGKSRFFLIPKADREERERGLADAPKGMVAGRNRADGRQWDIPGSTLANGKPPRANTHPTVKPLDLMKHLVRLVTPPGGLIVDPFVGSGTTALAASEEGFRCIGIDQSEDYLKIAEGRLMATPIGLGLSA